LTPKALTLHRVSSRFLRASLAAVLRNKLRRGRIDDGSASRRYVLNGGLPAGVRRALLNLDPAGPS
jgi:hypothetical protein